MIDQQLPLGFPPRHRFDAASYVIGAANRAAHAWVMRWPDWPAHGLLLHGPRGAGKSHLAALWAERSGAGTVVTAAGLEAALSHAVNAATRLVVEDIDALIGSAAAERRMFHLWNATAEKGGSLLLTASGPAAAMPIALPDLASRLRALPSVGLPPPDDDLIAALLAKQLADRGLPLPDAVLGYLLPRIERAYEAIADLVAALDRDATIRRQGLTVPLVSQCLNRRTDRDSPSDPLE